MDAVTSGESYKSRTSQNYRGKNGRHDEDVNWNGRAGRREDSFVERKEGEGEGGGEEKEIIYRDWTIKFQNRKYRAPVPQCPSATLHDSEPGRGGLVLYRAGPYAGQRIHHQHGRDSSTPLESSGPGHFSHFSHDLFSIGYQRPMRQKPENPASLTRRLMTISRTFTR
ncbi:hypothetical protein B7494_g3843 [Chlorociboria aeruginascens]|nr:hypothetical protein B7494_g3843 [Chlorociboria aeruginascens]